MDSAWVPRRRVTLARSLSHCVTTGGPAQRLAHPYGSSFLAIYFEDVMEPAVLTGRHPGVAGQEGAFLFPSLICSLSIWGRMSLLTLNPRCSLQRKQDFTV